MPDLGRSHVPAEGIADILGDSCCLVFAVLLFPDMELDRAIVSAAKHRNVHPLSDTDNLMGRFKATAARKDCRISNLSYGPSAAFPVGYAAEGGISHS